jgi:hypothetical protein
MQGPGKKVAQLHTSVKVKQWPSAQADRRRSFSTKYDHNKEKSESIIKHKKEQSTCPQVYSISIKEKKEIQVSHLLCTTAMTESVKQRTLKSPPEDVTTNKNRVVFMG